MLTASLRELPACDGVIAAAAPCDFEPVKRQPGKIPRQGTGLTLELKPTTDIIATLARRERPGQWFVAFALEPGADPQRAFAKITAKKCDLIVVNDVTALEAEKNAVAVYDAGHEHVGSKRGTKRAVANWLVRLIEKRLVAPVGRNSV
jgi:phosphopantothenoylcysteine decarboxylase/phosphopantothenate--cysteine ligase